MVQISSLRIRNLRIIKELGIAPAARVNWIIGGNGAGKTSLLEAVFLLARGKSFRRFRQGKLVREGQNELFIEANLLGHGVRETVKMLAGPRNKRLFRNGTPVKRMRDLADGIHVRMIPENAQNLLESDPALRRLFLDWNLFHVEHRYPDIYSDFRRVSLQRNAWLRNGAPGRRIWDEEYVYLGEAVSAHRVAFVDMLAQELGRLASRFPDTPRIRVEYSKGWPERKNLSDLLVLSYEQDKKRGYTLYGPGRGDLRVTADGVFAIGSRGQAKVFVCLLQCAAQAICEQTSGISCVWLLDDISAELDQRALSSVWAMFFSTEKQIFATCRSIQDVHQNSGGGDPTRVFHVEQGELRNC